MDDGLNAKNSTVQRIKTRKILAVAILNDKSISKEEKYWLNDKTGIVYDYELDYPVGKLEKDENNNFTLIDNKTYIINQLIQIPKYQIYT